MNLRIGGIAIMLAPLPMLLTNGPAQTLQKGSTLTIAGHPGEAQLVQVNGKSYIDIETLARLTRGSLSFKANQTIPSLPPSDPEVQTPAPHTRAGFPKAL